MSGLASAADKFVALTFDDGPDTVQTARVLDRLKAHGAKATFFVLGERLTPAHHGVVERIKAEGHEIGVHGFDHKALDKLSAPGGQGRNREGLRRRGGWHRDQARLVPRHLPVGQPHADGGHRPALAGGIAAFDWPGTDAVTAQQRAQKVLQSADPGNGAIILLHDVQPEPHPSAEPGHPDPGLKRPGLWLP